MVDWFIMVGGFGTDAQSACGCCAEIGGIKINVKTGVIGQNVLMASPIR